MSKKFVRSVKNVTDIDQFSKNVLEENDIISTQDGKVFIKGKSDYIEVGGSGASENVEQLKTDIKSLKSTNTKLTNRVTALETQATDFENRIKALETPTPEE